MGPAEKIGPILKLLDEHYGEAHCTLDFTNPLELLVATVLSAQCTDVRVNQVTPALFRQYPTAAHYANADLTDLEQAIYTTGFYRQKARSLKALCQDLVTKFGGQVPASLDDLVKLPGIGRKTANVILGNAFGIPGVVVDTHISRVAQRLGLTRQKDPVKIEFDLMPLVPKERWVKFSHQLIAHGRRICPPKNPTVPTAPCCPIVITGPGLWAGQLDTPIDSWHKTENRGRSETMQRQRRLKLAAVLMAMAMAAGCAATLLMGVGGLTALGTYKWVEGTMEKDYPRPMQETFNATMEAAKRLNLKISSESVHPLGVQDPGVDPGRHQCQG